MSGYQIFRNGTLVTDTGLTKDGIVLARQGRIEYAGGWKETPEGAEVIDAEGLYIAPGFIDLHVHGGGGSDFMDASPEDTAAVFRYHALHGTTALCPTTCAAPLPDILAALDAIAGYRKSGEAWGRALGAHIEGPYLAMSKRGCHLPQHVRNPERAEWEQILERGPVAAMTLAPELPGAQQLIGALRRRGANASAGHSEALFPEMQTAVEWGVNHVTHLYCAMTDALNNRWRGTANPRRGGILEATLLDDRLSSELISDGIHLSAEMLLMAFRSKGYEKLALVTDAMRGAGMPDGDYAFGPRNGLAATVRRGEARVASGVGLASSVCPMNEMVRIFRDLTGCPLWQAVRMASLAPATILGIADCFGSLAAGKWADIVLFDESVKVQAVYVAGRKLQ